MATDSHLAAALLPASQPARRAAESLTVAIFGLGYVGSVTAGCLSRDGHRVIGVDVNSEKVERVKSGHSPVTEPGLEELFLSGLETGNLDARTDGLRAVEEADVALICVGTPSKADGSVDLHCVEQVCRDIGRGLRSRQSYLVIAVRSTIFPGTSAGRLIPIIEVESGKSAGVDFGFCVNPEFLREGSAIEDTDRPPYTVIGELDERSGNVVGNLRRGTGEEVVRVTLEVAEMIKYACNSFHALKVVFANEVATLCEANGVDSRVVMDLLVKDTKLNLSARYLAPGFAFGGSCLPKDVRALVQAAHDEKVELPLLEAVLPSNQLHADRAFQMIRAEKGKKVALIGLSFKARTDDLRESPAVQLTERLIQSGFEVAIWDPDVVPQGLHGGNLDYAERLLGHVSDLLCPSLDLALEHAEVIVIAKGLAPPDLHELLLRLRPLHRVIDLVGTPGPEIRELPGSYRGLCW